MWLAQFVCAPQFFKTPSGLCGHNVWLSGDNGDNAKPKPLIIMADIAVGSNVHSKLIHQKAVMRSETVAPI
jgi:hypothetical protein